MAAIPDHHDAHALIPWVRRRWIEISGKHGTTIISPERFLLKPRSSCEIDRQTFLKMRRTLQEFNATTDAAWRLQKQTMPHRVSAEL